MAPGVQHKSIPSSEIDVLALEVRRSINMTILHHSLRNATGAGSTQDTEDTTEEDYTVGFRADVIYGESITLSKRVIHISVLNFRSVPHD